MSENPDKPKYPVSNRIKERLARNLPHTKPVNVEIDVYATCSKMINDQLYRLKKINDKQVLSINETKQLHELMKLHLLIEGKDKESSKIITEDELREAAAVLGLNQDIVETNPTNLFESDSIEPESTESTESDALIDYPDLNKKF